MSAEQTPHKSDSSEAISGTLAGQHFSITSVHLIEVLLIVSLSVFFFLVFRNTRDVYDKYIIPVKEEHVAIRISLSELASMLAILDYNIGTVPERRIPLHLSCKDATEMIRQKNGGH